jgi:hypothetical protein
MLKRSSALVAFVALFLGICGGSFVAADDNGGLDFGLSLGIGAETFIEGGVPVTYQMLKLSPDLAIGKFGIGLELTLHYTFTGGTGGDSLEVRRDDWWQGTDKIADVYLPKFKYIRYGFKGDPLYAKLGSIDDATLGDGFIMGDYENTRFLPDTRIFGLSFDLDGQLFNFPYVGIETFVGNLAQFDVIAMRPFIRPLAGTQIPVIKNLQVGGTLAMDRKPGLYSTNPALDDAETIILYGADLRLPILANPAISLITFTDVARLHNTGGVGGMVGFGGRLFGFLNYGAQLRILGENFIPTYFDSAYDLFREDKYLSVQAENISAYNGWLASLGFSFFGDLLVFNASLDGPFGQPTGGTTALDYPHLYATFLLGQGLVPNVSLEAGLDKRSIGDTPFFGKEDTALQARLNYSIGAAVLSFVYQMTWDPASGDWVTKSGIETGIQFF